MRKKQNSASSHQTSPNAVQAAMSQSESGHIMQIEDQSSIQSIRNYKGSSGKAAQESSVQDIYRQNQQLGQIEDSQDSVQIIEVRQVEEKFGSWEQESAAEVEQYLVGIQRKFIKYRLNIFELNRCALRLQHFFHKRRMLRLQVEATMKMEAQLQLEEQREAELAMATKATQILDVQGSTVAYSGQQSSQSNATMAFQTIQENSQESSSQVQQTYSQTNYSVSGSADPPQESRTTVTETVTMGRGSSSKKTKMASYMSATASTRAKTGNTGTIENKRYVNETVPAKESMTSEETSVHLNKSTPHFSSPAAAALKAQQNAAASSTVTTFTTSMNVGKVESGKKEEQETVRTTPSKIKVSMASGPRKGSPTYRSQLSSKQTSATNVKEVQVEQKSARASQSNSSGSKTFQYRAANRSAAKESHSSSKNSVTKTVGGTTTTTTTSTTTTFTRNGKVVGKSKSIDRKVASKPGKATTTTTTTTAAGASSRRLIGGAPASTIKTVEVSPQKVSQKEVISQAAEVQSYTINEDSQASYVEQKAQKSIEDRNGQFPPVSVLHQSYVEIQRPSEEYSNSEVQIITMQMSGSNKEQTFKSSMSSNIEKVDENLMNNSVAAMDQLTRGAQSRRNELESLSKSRSRGSSLAKKSVEHHNNATEEQSQKESNSFYQNSKSLVSQEYQEQSSYVSRASMGAKSQKSKTATATASQKSGQKQTRKQISVTNTEETTGANLKDQVSKKSKKSLDSGLDSTGGKGLRDQRQSEYAQSQQKFKYPQESAPSDPSTSFRQMTTRSAQLVVEKERNTDLKSATSSSKDIIKAAFDNKIKAQQLEKQQRSVSQLSSRSTFSTEQKKIGSKQNLNPIMLAANSTTRFQERLERKSRDQRSEWKDLEMTSTSQKGKYTSQEREEKLRRQEEITRKLMMPTRSSQLKIRGGDSGRDVSPDEVPFAMKSSRSHQVLNIHTPNNDNSAKFNSTSRYSQVEVIPEFANSTKTSLARASVTNRDSVKRQGLQSKSANKWSNNFSRNDSKVTSLTTTTKNSIVSTKGGETTTEVTTRKSDARSTVKTPRIIYNKSNLNSRQTLQDESPIRNRSRSGLKMTSNTVTGASINQQGKAQTKSRSRVTNLVISQTDSSTFQEKERQYMPSPVKSSKSGKSQKSRSSIQAGGIEYTGQQVSEEKSIEDHIRIQEVVPSTSSLQRQSKGQHSQSMVAMSTSSYQMAPSHNSVKDLPETPGRAIVKTTTTITSTRGIPQNSQARATVRRYKETTQQRQEVDEVLSLSQKSNTLSSSQKQKSTESRKSVGPASRKSVIHGSSASQKTKIAVKEDQHHIMSEETKIRPTFEYQTEASIFVAQSEQEQAIDRASDFEAQFQAKPVVEKERGFSFDKTQEHEEKRMYPTFGSEATGEEKGYRTLQQSPIKDTEQLEIYDTGKSSHKNLEQELSFSNLSAEQKQYQQKFEQMPTILETQYQADTKGHLQKCLLEDLALSKVQKSFRQDFIQLKEVLQKEYHKINAVFLYYVGQSHAYPALSEEDFLSFAVECDLLNATSITQETLLQCFKETIVSTNNLKKSDESILYRYEFVEVIVRIAAAIFKQSKSVGNLTKTLQSLFTDVIFRNARSVNKYKFRKNLIQDSRVSLLLNANQEVIELAYGYFTHERKSYVALEECVALARQCQLDIPDAMVGIIFAESQETILNALKNKERMYQLSFAEFVYFLCRLTKEHYEDTEYAEEEFYIKLDQLLIFILEPFDLAPRFRFKAAFEVDIQEATNRSLSTQNEFLEQKIGESRVQVTTTTQELRTSQDSVAHDGDITAWPQPCPIAYPQRQEFNNSKMPALAIPQDQSIQNSSEAQSFSENSVHVTGRRHKTMITQQRTKVRSYLSSQKKEQQQQKR